MAGSGHGQDRAARLASLRFRLRLAGGSQTLRVSRFRSAIVSRRDASAAGRRQRFYPCFEDGKLCLQLTILGSQFLIQPLNGSKCYTKRINGRDVNIISAIETECGQEVLGRRANVSHI